MRHAYLILAHNEFALLNLLIKTLDDGRNDIFVHIDAKVKNLPELKTEHAGLYVLKDRVDVRWGDWSVVEAEYALFEAAYQEGVYSYYHLLSGVDLPLKSQNYINEFFEKNFGKEFIGYTLKSINPEIVRKVRRYHLFPKDFKDAGLFKKALRAGCIRIQEVLGIKRNRKVNFTKGSQWVSVTEQMTRLFLDNKEWARKTFHHTFCSDEIVFQTLCWNSPLKDNLFNTEYDGTGCMRAIGWRGNQLVDWSASDFETLKNSTALFARKFNGSDMDFIDKVLSLSADE